jgi:cell surface protein SprA
MEIVNENRVNFTAAEQADGAKVLIEGKVKQSRNPIIVTGESLIRALMGIRSVSLTYTSSQGEYLPGFSPGTKLLGMSRVNNKLAPGWPFILGIGDKNFFDKAVSNGWITKDTLLNTAATYDNSNSLSIRSLIEPFPGLRIDLNADRRYLEAINSYYAADHNGNFPDSIRNRMATGNYSHGGPLLKRSQRIMIMNLRHLKLLRRI